MGDNNKNEWPVELPPYTEFEDELAGPINFEEIFEMLPAASSGPSTSIDQSKNKKGSKGQKGTPKTTKKTEGRSSRRIYTKDEIMQRRADRQKQYRDRQRQEGADTKKQIAETAVVLEAERAENEILVAHNTVLSKAVDYCISSAHAVQALVSDTVGKVQTQYHTTVDWLAWLGLQVYSPTDAQLHALVDKKDAEELNSVSEQMIARCYELFLRYDAEPEQRENIEAQLARVQSIRFRATTHLVNTRPDIVVDMARRRMMPTGPDGAPNPKLVEAVAVLNLTPEQLESFEQQWILYLQKTESMRQEARSLINLLTSSNAGLNIASMCSIGAASSSLFLKNLEAVQELELHPSKEAQAATALILWIPPNLTTQQKMVLMKHSTPYYPDIIQMGRILFGDRPDEKMLIE